MPPRPTTRLRPEGRHSGRDLGASAFVAAVRTPGSTAARARHGRSPDVGFFDTPEAARARGTRRKRYR